MWVPLLSTSASFELLLTLFGSKGKVNLNFPWSAIGCNPIT